MVEVAQLCNYKGTIWATWDTSAPPFLEYLGDFKLYLDLSLDAWDGREGVPRSWVASRSGLFPATGSSRRKTSAATAIIILATARWTWWALVPAAQDAGTWERLQARRLQICFPERGHQTGVYLLPKDQPTPVAYQHSPVVSTYFRHCEEERRQRRGEWGRLTGSPGEIFPNTALHPRQPRTIAVWHPRGAHQTEVWRWYLVDQESPPEVKDFLRQYYIRYPGPVG